MSICVNCGTEVGNGTFCTNCGKAVIAPAPDAGQFAQIPPIPPMMYEAPKKAPPKKLFALIGGVGVLVVGAIVLATTMTSPLKLDAATADDVLFGARDFSVDVAQSEDAITIAESDNPVFGAGEQCEPDARLARLISSSGTQLASRDFNSVKSGIYVNQDILEFDSVESAQEFIALTQEGLDFPDCEFNSVTDSSTFLTTLSVIGDTQDVYGVGSDESVVWAEDQEIYAPALGFDLSSDSQVAVVRENNYVLVLNGTVYRDTDDFGSIRDLEDDFAVIVEQFVSGKKIN